MDLADIAAETTEAWLQKKIAQQRAALPAGAVSARACAGCGAEIPELRRRAVPGVVLCVDCQSWAERSDR